MMKLRTDVPFELKAIIRDKVIRRQKALSRVTEKALSRVTEKAILESSLAEDRKLDLLRARDRYMKRRRELEKSRDRGL